MAKPELGAKRTCQACGAKYYDLMRDPIVCPKCGTTFVATVIVSSAAAVRAAKAEALRNKKAAEDEAETPEEAEDLDTIPLEEADEDTTGVVKVAGADDDDTDDEAETDETFLEPDEDSDEDVTVIIGDRENNEET